MLLGSFDRTRATSLCMVTALNRRVVARLPIMLGTFVVNEVFI